MNQEENQRSKSSDSTGNSIQSAGEKDPLANTKPVQSVSKKKQFKKHPQKQKGKENGYNHDSSRTVQSLSTKEKASAQATQQVIMNQEENQRSKSSDSTGTFIQLEKHVTEEKDPLTGTKPVHPLSTSKEQMKESQKEKTESSGSTSTSNQPARHATEEKDPLTDIKPVQSLGTMEESQKENLVPMSEEKDTANASAHAENEKERMKRLLREAREKSAAAKERKKSKKSHKIDQWIKEQEAQKSKRAKSWHDKIAKEKENISLISQLIVAEVLRQNKDRFVNTELVFQEFQDLVTSQAEEANTAIYGGLKCRVKVTSERKDLNGRQGTLRYWDADKGKFAVGLDTKKNQDSDLQFLMPENLEAVPSPRSSKADKRPVAYTVDIIYQFDEEIDGIRCRFTLEKYDIDALRSADSIDAGLKVFCQERDWSERKLRVALEKERLEEEHRRQQEEKEALERKRLAKERAERRERAKEQRRRQREAKSRTFFERRTNFGDQLLRELGLRLLMLRALEEGIPPGELLDFLMENGFGPEDVGIIEDFFEEYEDFFRKFEDELQQDNEEEAREMAAILGVEPDANERTLTVTYRKLALKFHPDKWRNDSDHGMTKDESEEHFKAIQSAYDFLISRLDGDNGQGAEFF